MAKPTRRRRHELEGGRTWRWTWRIRGSPPILCPMADTAEHQDRRALITGASRGIGAATAAALTAVGWTVVTPTREELDLSSRASVDGFLRDQGTDFDGLVLNAGMNNPQLLSALEMSAWDEILQVDLSSNVALIKAICPGMAARGFGRVVAVSSGLAGADYAESRGLLRGQVGIGVDGPIGGRGVRCARCGGQCCGAGNHHD